MRRNHLNRTSIVASVATTASFAMSVYRSTWPSCSPMTNASTGDAQAWYAPSRPAVAGGASPSVLTRTLTEFNAAAAAGRDDLFGRRAGYLAALDLADLYAIELWPAVATTSGGPRRDARSRVVRPDGTAVAGLYAAGGAGTVWGPFTHSGGGLTDALVFGRLAGQHAAGA